MGNLYLLLHVAKSVGNLELDACRLKFYWRFHESSHETTTIQYKIMYTFVLIILEDLRTARRSTTVDEPLHRQSKDAFLFLFNTNLTIFPMFTSNCDSYNSWLSVDITFKTLCFTEVCTHVTLSNEWQIC